MHEVFNRNVFLVKEHVGLFKAANNFDILDPETGQIIVECREETLGIITKLFRFTGYKRYTPFDIQLRAPDGTPLLRVKRGIAIIRSTVYVHDGEDQVLGSFKQKLFKLLGGAFDVLDPDGQLMFTLKGKWTGWDFRFLAGDLELAHVSKKWAGLGKEILTSADSYVIEISEEVPPDSPARQLILGTVMCIDMVLKE